MYIVWVDEYVYNRVCADSLKDVYWPPNLSRYIIKYVRLFVCQSWLNKQVQKNQDSVFIYIENHPRSHFTSHNMTKIKMMDYNKFWLRCGEIRKHIMLTKNIKFWNFQKYLEAPQNNKHSCHITHQFHPLVFINKHICSHKNLTQGYL